MITVDQVAQVAHRVEYQLNTQLEQRQTNQE